MNPEPEYVVLLVDASVGAEYSFLVISDKKGYLSKIEFNPKSANPDQFSEKEAAIQGAKLAGQKFVAIGTVKNGVASIHSFDGTTDQETKQRLTEFEKRCNGGPTQ